MRRFLLTGVAVLGVAAAAAAQAGSPRAAIEAIGKQFGAAAAKGDAAAIASLYTADAKAYPPGGPTATGRAEIEKLWKGALDSGIKGITLTTDEAEAMGDMAYETGRFTIMGADGKQLDHGKYVVIYKRENGTWKLYRDIWNSSAPPMAH